MDIYTIGHSTNTLEEIESLLASNGVERLIDIRSYPGSRYVPCWNKENIVFDELDYIHLPEIGGRRKGLPGATGNEAWRNKSFRNYADYMQTDDFAEGIVMLEKLANEYTSAIMCSEHVPWRCHRSLVSDALLVRGWTVNNIYGGKVTVDTLTSFACVEGTTITYPAKL